MVDPKPSAEAGAEPVALPPCPFCSGQGVLRQDNDPGYPFYVTFEHAQTCAMYAVPTDLFRSYATEAEALAAWTPRYAAPPTEAAPVAGDVVELVAKAAFAILWQGECYNGITANDVDACRIGGHLNMGGRVEKLEAKAQDIAQAALAAIGPAPTEAAIRADEREKCAAVGYRVCAETRHVTLGDKVAFAIRSRGDA